jgi:hypothetical protein
MVFCVKCGNELREGEIFCTKCGYNTETGQGGIYSEPYNQNRGPQLSQRARRIGEVLNITYWFGIIWAILAFLNGIGYFAIYYLFATLDISFSYSYDPLLFIAGMAFLVLGSLLILSGLCATICCYFINKPERHKLSCNLCLIGSVLAIASGSFSYGVAGIVHYRLMKKEQGRFSQSPTYSAAGTGTENNYYGSNDHNYNNQNYSQGQGLNGTLMIILTLGVVWGAGSFTTALSFTSSAYKYSALDILYVGTLFQVTYIILAILVLASGILAILCCYNIYKLENHKKACTYCLIGSILALPFVVPGIIGIVFYSQLKDQKHLFRS